mmetsp:Transcript_18538/g.45935  ORF Transcript_18538/g.45935 Transcript_18538/m.45935 type:complete len:534 (-) Transcript_18538:60-1661(-)
MSEEGVDIEVAVEVEVDEKSSMLLGYILVLVGIIAAAAYYFFFQKKEKKRGSDVDVDEALATNTVGLADITYIASKLTPESDPLDVLLAVASTPESILWSTKSLGNREKLIAKRIEADKEEEAKKKAEAKKSTDDKLFDLDDDGWADDDDEDEETKKKAELSKKIMEEKQKLGKEVAKASGKMKIPVEGMDDGVIGQEWVEKTLGRTGVWPPEDLRFLKDMKFDYKGKKVSAMDHPGLRRNLCFVAGRLNSLALNTHPELLEAASKQLVDPTYFKSAADFRQRCAMLLEATLRSAVSLRSYPLTKTIVEAVSIFKIGCRDCKQKEIEWFDSIMKRQYAVLPRLKIENTSIASAKHPEMATEDVLLISLDLTRLHAENFTRQKVAMCQKQGIPPQVALQQYREGWWYFVTGERVDGETPASCAAIKKEGTLLEKVNEEDLARFEKSSFEERLLTAWPMIVANVAQKSGKVKIQFKAPSVAGKYKFHVSVKSQDFLGADQVFTVEADIVDASTLDRPEEEETKGDDKEDEGKKDK